MNFMKYVQITYFACVAIIMSYLSWGSKIHDFPYFTYKILVWGRSLGSYKYIHVHIWQGPAVPHAHRWSALPQWQPSPICGHLGIPRRASAWSQVATGRPHGEGLNQEIQKILNKYAKNRQTSMKQI